MKHVKTIAHLTDDSAQEATDALDLLAEGIADAMEETAAMLYNLGLTERAAESYVKGRSRLAVRETAICEEGTP